MITSDGLKQIQERVLADIATLHYFPQLEEPSFKYVFIKLILLLLALWPIHFLNYLQHRQRSLYLYRDLGFEGFDAQALINIAEDCIQESIPEVERGWLQMRGQLFYLLPVVFMDEVSQNRLDQGLRESTDDHVCCIQPIQVLVKVSGNEERVKVLNEFVRCGDFFVGLDQL